MKLACSCTSRNCIQTFGPVTWTVLHVKPCLVPLKRGGCNIAALTRTLVDSKGHLTYIIILELWSICKYWKTGVTSMFQPGFIVQTSYICCRSPGDRICVSAAASLPYPSDTAYPKALITPTKPFGFRVTWEWTTPVFVRKEVRRFSSRDHFL